MTIKACQFINSHLIFAGRFLCIAIPKYSSLRVPDNICRLQSGSFAATFSAIEKIIIIRVNIIVAEKRRGVQGSAWWFMRGFTVFDSYVIEERRDGWTDRPSYNFSF